MRAQVSERLRLRRSIQIEREKPAQSVSSQEIRWLLTITSSLPNMDDLPGGGVKGPGEKQGLNMSTINTDQTPTRDGGAKGSSLAEEKMDKQRTKANRSQDSKEKAKEQRKNGALKHSLYVVLEAAGIANVEDLSKLLAAQKKAKKEREEAEKLGDNSAERILQLALSLQEQTESAKSDQVKAHVSEALFNQGVKNLKMSNREILVQNQKDQAEIARQAEELASLKARAAENPFLSRRAKGDAPLGLDEEFWRLVIILEREYKERKSLEALNKLVGQFLARIDEWVS